MNKMLLISAVLSGFIHCGFFLAYGFRDEDAAVETVTIIKDVELTEPEPPALLIRSKTEPKDDEPTLPDKFICTGLSEPQPKAVAIEVLAQYVSIPAPRMKRPDQLVIGIPTGAQRTSVEGVKDRLVFSLEQLDTIPHLRRGAKPRYPRQMLASHIEGIVRMLVILDERGRVTVQKVLEANYAEFEGPAIESAEKFVYDPPTKNGKPVNTEFILPIRFLIE